MAYRYSLTFQINPDLPGHAAVVVNQPDKQTYAGFGPQHHRSSKDQGQFDVHTLQTGRMPPPDYSSVVGDGQYKSYTIPITEEQSRKALSEIQRLRTSNEVYNGRILLDPNVCTTIVNRIAEAAGLDGNLLYLLPSRSNQ
jgi:hypothetical protein